MRFLLDTNVVSDLVRHPRGRIAARIAEVGEQHICTSIIMAAELRMAPQKRARPPGASLDPHEQTIAVLEQAAGPTLAVSSDRCCAHAIVRG